VDPESLNGQDKDATKKAFWENADIQAALKETKALSTYKGADFDCIMLVGGFGVMFDFFPNADIDRVSRECYENNNGVVAAVCHGPIGLASINLSNGEPLVKGKNVAGFTDEEEAALGLTQYYPDYPTTGKTVETILAEKGGNHTKTANWGEHVVVDGRIVSGQNPASADKVGLEVVKIFSA
jgi:putative intracellular protease/amidase